MNTRSHGIAAALAGAWKAVVKAFTPTHASSIESQAYGNDTTLFGAIAEPTGTGRKPGAAEDSFGPTGDSSYFADNESPGQDRKHR